MATQSMAMMSCGHSARGGSGRRSTTSTASEHSPAIAARIAVTAIGSIADTAIRVAGSVPPKITMPTKPSNRPRRAREADAHECVVEDMARPDNGFARIAYSNPLGAHGGHARLPRCNAAPHQAEAGQEQQAQHDVAEIAVAERVIDARADPCADDGAGEGDQRQPDTLPS